MKKLSLIGICLLGILIAGCGEKAEPPLTTDALDPNAVTTENSGQTAGAAPSRPQPNPNAKYSPTR